MNELPRTDRRMPYPEVDLDALHRRIRSATAERAAARSARRPLGRTVLAASVAAALLAVGIFLSERYRAAPADPAADFEAMLASASAEVVSDAAATAYDDILYNQQL